MNLKVGIKLFFIGVLLFLGNPIFCQYATSGKIIFERRTNLEKRFTDKRMKRMINETNKNESVYLKNLQSKKHSPSLHHLTMQTIALGNRIV